MSCFDSSSSMHLNEFLLNVMEKCEVANRTVKTNVRNRWEGRDVEFGFEIVLLLDF